jgi:hypothetical protein
LNNNPVWSGKLINISWYVVALVLFLGLGSYYNWIERHTMIVKHLISTKQYTPRLNWK